MEADPRVLQQAAYLMWLEDLNATDDKGHADWVKRRAAADQICEMVGAKDLIRAIAMDGELRPPPKWPAVDIVPVGGGPGLITCEVRTWDEAKGKVKVKIALARKGKVFDAAQIGEAVDRGRFELRKLLAA